MKYLALFIPLLFSIIVSAQPVKPESLYQLPTFPLEISWHKTSLIIFPQPIRRADRGDAYVLAETFRDADNILKVKAGKRGFDESNLQVITVDGKVYSFTVNYNEKISGRPIDMGKVNTYAPITFAGISLNSKEIDDWSGKISESNAFLNGGHFHKYGLNLALEGIYVKNDVLFFQLRLRNATQIPYDPASIRFYIRDRKKAKRTAEQESEVEPLNILQTGSPQSGKGCTIVAAFQRFTIAESKFFSFEIMERNGDRNPTIRLRQKKLLKARSL